MHSKFLIETSIVNVLVFSPQLFISPACIFLSFLIKIRRLDILCCIVASPTNILRYEKTFVSQELF